MALTAAGIGSGLNVESMITQLVAVQKQSLQPLQQKATVLDSKISTFGQLKSLMSQLSDAAKALAAPDAWRVSSVASSGTAVAATVTGTGALSGAAEVTVSQLARAQTVASGVMDAGTRFDAGGSLTISMGRWSENASQFTGSGTSVTINIAQAATLEDVVSSINGQNSGVVASVLKDAQGERLVLRSRETGADAGFSVSTSGDPGLSQLAFNGTPASGATVQMAQNAKAVVNGIDVESTTNELKQTLPGLSLTLNQITSAPVTVSVSSDTEALKKKLQTFVDAYNALNDLMVNSTKYDAESKKGGVLQGDSTTVGMTNGLRSVLAGTVDGATLGRLSDMGLQIEKGGKLSFGSSASDKAKFEAALKNTEALGQLFGAAGVEGQSTTQGLAVRMQEFTRQLLEFDGTIDLKNKGLQELKKSNGKAQEKVNEQAVALEKRLRTQYASLDSKMANLSKLSAYMSQQVAQWNKG
ncbi:flagellar filament capping protein FliD [Comamonas composti]|uniref:flagellar filament capping protein FliD n=1 Tax=Comamonas composti TaxID=408558 RepID=UPI000416638B|nr:flagellar filament capping protein FliD [Comamonas composti]